MSRRGIRRSDSQGPIATYLIERLKLEFLTVCTDPIDNIALNGSQGWFRREGNPRWVGVITFTNLFLEPASLEGLSTMTDLSNATSFSITVCPKREHTYIVCLHPTSST